jgi:copper resistance protein C
MGVTAMRRILRISLLLLVATTAGSSARAHALLKRASPPAGSVISPGPGRLQLTFSEGVELAFSKVGIAINDGMSIMPRSVTLSPDDPATIIVSFGKPLGPGHYIVTWHVLSVDTHRTQGHYDFTVKR